MVTIHDIFTTRAFGDSSLIFVTDYHPCSSTLSEHHFASTSTYRHNDRFGNRSQSTHVPEATLWSYIVQIASALKTIHSNGIAAQLIHPSKVLLTSQKRIRLNGCGVLDVVKFSPQTGLQKSFTLEQQEDLVQLGRLVVSIAAGNINAYASPYKALETLSRSYTERFHECIQWLLAPPQQQHKDIDVLLSEISSHVVSVMDNSLHALDTMESTLATSLEDGRIARLEMKLHIILERAESEHNAAWSETGERYMIKLFRDYVFHGVDATGRPNTDLSHIIGCLNRLDAGSSETIQLASRDGETAFLVAYRDLKRAVEGAFNELTGGTGGVAGAKDRK